MDSNIPNDAITDESVPLCFDTSAIFGLRAGPRLLLKTRERFPQRSLLVPAWVVAERARQIKVEQGARFNPARLRSFLEDEDLRIEVPVFDREVALGAWLAVVGRFSNDQWRGGEQAQEQRPCAERCRLGDHIVFAFAVAHGALLVTGDGGLLEQVERDKAKPGCIHLKILMDFLGYPESQEYA